MSNEPAISVEGKIVSILPGTMFRVELPNNQVVLAHISGKMRKRFIRLNLGDRVKLRCRRTISARPESFIGWAERGGRKFNGLCERYLSMTK